MWNGGWIGMSSIPLFLRELRALGKTRGTDPGCRNSAACTPGTRPIKGGSPPEQLRRRRCEAPNAVDRQNRATGMESHPRRTRLTSLHVRDRLSRHSGSRPGHPEQPPGTLGALVMELVQRANRTEESVEHPGHPRQRAARHGVERRPDHALGSARVGCVLPTRSVDDTPPFPPRGTPTSIRWSTRDPALRAPVFFAAPPGPHRERKERT